ncbi:MAG: UDP-N-acetylmuramoyl-L-alanyl-D-glutamate--2,6-diaminopimelate ligase [Ruthenibacterium sp.]
MKPQELFEGIAYEGILPQEDITLVTQDSRRVAPGAVFVCAKGQLSDGHDYAQKAIDAGASCVVTEHALHLAHEITVENGRKAYALLCANFFGNPAKKLRLAAVTGTNGKTTVSTLIKQILEQNGHKVGLIGTIHTEIDTMEVPAKYTTPEAWDLHALLARMVAAGCDMAVMEASSQALDQMRLWGLTFEVGVFTNLTQDHLDYHKTFENYFAAKKSLFAQVKTVIANVDDMYGRRIAADSTAEQIITISAKDDTADYTAHNLELSAAGVKFEMVGKNFIQRIKFPMPGDYSVYNALCAAAAAIAMGIAPANTAKALSTSHGVRGRCEVLYHGDFTILCDFAHTGDAIEKALAGIAPFVKNRFLVLFGCAGERDAKKRPLMSAAVVKYADFAILTSDNPRKENPYDIIKDAEPTLKAAKLPYLVEVERRAALHKALEMLETGDVLMLCGKGHEDYQVIDGVTIYLDEHRIVTDWLRSKNLVQ